MALADTFSAWAPRQYELNLRLLAEAAKSVGAIPVLATEPRLVSATASDADRARIRYDWVGLSANALLSAFASSDSALRRAADLSGAVALDLAAKVRHRSEYFVDHVHTTPAGSERVAAEVAAVLGEIIATSTAAGGPRRARGTAPSR